MSKYLDFDLKKLHKALTIKITQEKVRYSTVVQELGKSGYYSLFVFKNRGSGKTKRISSVVSALMYLNNTDLRNFSCPQNENTTQ